MPGIFINETVIGWGLEQPINGLHDGVIVGLIGDLGHEFGVLDLVVGIYHKHSASAEATKWTFCDFGVVCFGELPKAEIGCDGHVFDSFCPTKAVHGKRQVFGENEAHGTVALAEFFIEFAGLHLAHACVEAWDCDQYFYLAFIIAHLAFGKVRLYEGEISSSAAGRQVANEREWGPFKGYSSHIVGEIL